MLTILHVLLLIYFTFPVLANYDVTIIYLISVYFIDDSKGKTTLYEGESFQLEYRTSRREWDVKIYKFNGILVDNDNTLFIKEVRHADEGIYYAECYGLRSKYTMLTVLRKFLCRNIVLICYV